MNDLSLKQFLYVRDVTGELPFIPDGLCDGCPGSEDPYEIGQWFYVELHVRHFGWFGPAAIATVHHTEYGTEMVALWVMESLRRQGLGRRLVEEVINRWGNVSWCSCDESRPFHQKLEAEGLAKARNDGSNYYVAGR